MICEELEIRLDMRRLYLAGFSSLKIDGARVKIVTTPCNFGGERRWFICPGCDRRCVVLYKWLRCRICLRARYRLEAYAPVDRMLLRAQRLRRKLGQENPNTIQPMPAKPHRMRSSTYMRAISKIRDLEYRAACVLDARLNSGRTSNGASAGVPGWQEGLSCPGYSLLVVHGPGGFAQWIHEENLDHQPG